MGSETPPEENVVTTANIIVLSVLALFVVPCAIRIAREEWNRNGVLRWPK